MANLARLMGLPGKVGIDGSKVHQSYLDGQYADIDTYCMQDVFQTAWIYQRYSYISGKITLEQYRSAADALLVFVREIPEQEEFASKVDEKTMRIVT